MKANVLVVAALIGCVAWGGMLSAEQAGRTGGAEVASCGADNKQPEVEAGVVYGNSGRWKWQYGHWWWVMDYDARYQAGGDIRRKCGNTGIHYIEREAIKSIQRKGYCLNLPGHPAWYKVTLIGTDITVANRLSAEAKMVAHEKVETLKEPDPLDETKPPVPKTP